VEIEKKYLLTSTDRLPLPDEGKAIHQGYLDVPLGELRLRQLGERYFQTVKGDGTISREEFEIELPEWVFRQLWPATAGRRVEKTRYTLPHQGLMLEIDLYEGALRGLVVLEVEFPSLEAAEGFALPDWALAAGAVDVTEDKRFKNKALAHHGLPELQ
jgi:adenylate cyclase